LNPQTIQEYFGTEDHHVNWEAVNTKEEHPNQVIDWIDAAITTHVEREIQEMYKRSQTLKIQEAYQISKGIATRRFFDKGQSPQC
jgi:predicted nucleic acid binding AN1-type Zn finger protein